MSRGISYSVEKPNGRWDIYSVWYDWTPAGPVIKRITGPNNEDVTGTLDESFVDLITARILEVEE